MKEYYEVVECNFLRENKGKFKSGYVRVCWSMLEYVALCHSVAAQFIRKRNGHAFIRMCVVYLSL